MTGSHGYHENDRLAAFVADDSSMAVERTCGMPPERSFAFMEF